MEFSSIPLHKGAYCRKDHHVESWDSTLHQVDTLTQPAEWWVSVREAFFAVEFSSFYRKYSETTWENVPVNPLGQNAL